MDHSVFDTFRDLPVHVLVLHLAVVLVPTASLATSVLAWRFGRRPRTAVVVLLLDLVTVAVVLVTRQSGEALQRRLPGSPAIQHHAELGRSLVWFAVALLAASALVLVTSTRRGRPADGTVRGRVRGGTAVRVLVAVLVTLTAAATVVQVVRVGESGATAVWRDIVVSTDRTVGG